MRNLNQYITNTDSNIFALKNLPPEVKAVLFAYYSRSDKGLKDTLSEVLETTGEYNETSGDLSAMEEKAANFHEKWVVGYGHSSVAEHAAISLGVENISILAAKQLEDNRLASYTEKSTRYVKFDRDSYYKVPEFDGTPFKNKYDDLCGDLLETYSTFLDKLQNIMADRIPKDGISEKLHAARVTSASCDVARYLLPVSTLTNVGVTANARTIANMVRKMKSSNLSEVTGIGTAIQVEASKICPTLIKYANKNDFIVKKREIIDRLTHRYVYMFHPASYFETNPDKVVNKIIDDMFYGREINSGYSKNDVLKEIMAERGEHDPLPREFEVVECVSDVLVDYGAFRDIQRHRMCTQINEDFHPDYGFEYPNLPEEDLIENYATLMNRSKDLYHEIVDYDKKLRPYASYCLPMAFKHWTLFYWNLREVGHFIELRSKPQGHYSYRQIAQTIWTDLNESCPEIMQYIRVNWE